MTNAQFLAVDLGATSGRTVLGSLADGRLRQREVSRFPNNIVEHDGHFYWDIHALYREITGALKLLADEGVSLTSIGIDTWGCDVVCIGSDGQVMREPYSYRDPHTRNAMEQYFRLVPKETVYAKTGIQFMPFNTLFQLSAMRHSNDAVLAKADKILFIPDALVYMLTGEAVCEYTILSTSQMMNARSKTIDPELIGAIGLRESQFGRYVNPCDRVGVLSAEVQKATGMGAVPVVAVAEHDTGAAVASVPASDERFAYLSCGTWSLLGIETRQAIISDKSFERNFTNEGGVEGTTRFLKNICGMWLLERCRKEWTAGEAPADIAVLTRDAAQAEGFRSFINPDDPRFANPVSMTAAIRDYCRQTGQPVPEDYRQTARCIFDSLAMRYRQVTDYLREFAPFPIERLHVIGGGTYNRPFMQMTADSTSLTVVTGPAEGTAIGNIMLQAKAAGLAGDIYEMRQVIAKSIDTCTYQPADREKWNKGYEAYLKVTG